MPPVDYGVAWGSVAAVAGGGSGNYPRPWEVAVVSRRLVTILVVAAGLVLVPGTAATAAAAPIGATTRVSVATGGTQASGHSSRSAISANGRYVAFSSGASNLVAGDTNGVEDVFVRDRVSGATTRVSVATDGTQANGGTGGSSAPAITADGRYVSFFSWAYNLVAGDTDNVGDVFVHDRLTGATTRVSVATDGSQANSDSVTSGDNETPSISADGRYVAFHSWASTLVPGDTNFDPDVFLHDRVTGATTRVSVATGGAQVNGGSYQPAISTDGRYIAFYSAASNLVAGDTNVTGDVFVRDRVSGATTRVSVATGGSQANGFSGRVAISADGRYVAFNSDATNLVAGDTNGRVDAFVRDRVAGATTRVSVANGGAQANDHIQAVDAPAISADGRYVAFGSWASNMVTGDTNGKQDVFVRDRVAGATTRVSIATSRAQANSDSFVGTMSGNGRHVAFWSQASNLVAGDTNGKQDVFVRDRLAPATPFGDFNGDGWPDVIARQTSTGSLYLYLGNGTAFVGSIRIGTGWSSMNSIARFGDFNRDGHEDVIARDSATGALWLYRGTGAGFSSRVKIGSGWSGMREITPVGDLTGDGYPDLLAVRASTGYLFLYSGRGASLGAGRQVGGGWNAMSELAGVGDFNRDGHVDLIARRSATGELWLYRGTGSGLGSGVRVGTGWNGMRDLVGVGDFDRDGFMDLTAVESATGNLLRYPWRGTSFGTPVLLGSGWTTAMGPLL